ncbi:MAG: hypothetical protein LBH29_03045 [Elusimicrobiota bacterium]|nr:hypothetical protein [Elusimicrobiota bacterium]
MNGANPHIAFIDNITTLILAVCFAIGLVFIFINETFLKLLFFLIASFASLWILSFANSFLYLIVAPFASLMDKQTNKNSFVLLLIITLTLTTAIIVLFCYLGYWTVFTYFLNIIPKSLKYIFLVYPFFMAAEFNHLTRKDPTPLNQITAFTINIGLCLYILLSLLFGFLPPIILALIVFISILPVQYISFSLAMENYNQKMDWK